MKLSRIIELALVKFYGPDHYHDQFLCNAVETLRRQGFIDKKQEIEATQAISALMRKIYPKTQQYTMVNALKEAGYIKHTEIYSNLPYTTQLYVWWVFDLKNKGL